jgi:hypothetical protein
MFVSDGVYISSIAEPSSLSFHTRVLTLVDADAGKLEAVPEFLIGLGSLYLVVFVTSTKDNRWKGLTKTTEWTIIYMNPWTRNEISNALAHPHLHSIIQTDNFFLCSAAIHGFEPNDSRIYDMYSQHGPTPRICFEYSESHTQLAEHESRRSTALSQLSLNTLEEMAHRSSGSSSGSNDKYGDTSHRIILLRRGDTLYGHTVEPITRNVEMALRDRLGRGVRADRLRLYHYLASDKWSRALAGVLYESLIQEDLRESPRFDLDLVTMSRRGGTGRWRCNHVGAASQSVSIARTRNDSFSKPAVINPNVYYYPRHPNQAAFDSFILSDQHPDQQLFIFQFTTSSTHDVKKGITDFFSQGSLPPKSNWYFVFVIPTMSEEISCHDTFLDEPEIHLCSARVDPVMTEDLLEELA